MKETTARSRELGHELRRRRERIGITSVELADRLGWTYSKISRVETGWRGAAETDIVQYLAMLGLSFDEMRGLRALCRESARDLGYWLSGPESLAFHEGLAESVTAYCPDQLPAVLRIGVDEPVRPNPRRIYVLHERTVLGVSLEQTLKLLLLADVPSVSLRVVRGSFGGAYRLMEFVEHRPLVLVEAEFVDLLLEDHDAVASYHSLTDEILTTALDEDTSRELLVDFAARPGC